MIKEIREEAKLNMDGRPDELVDSVTNMAKGAVFHLFFEGENLRLKQFQNSIIKEIPDYTVIVAPWIFERSDNDLYTYREEGGATASFWVENSMLYFKTSETNQIFEHEKLNQIELDSLLSNLDEHGYYDLNLRKDVGRNILTFEEAIEMGIFEIAQLDKDPKQIKTVNPVYPSELRRERIQGTVIIEYTVNAEGKTEEINVISSPHPLFSEAAIDAIKETLFEPGEIDGRKVKAKVKQPINFQLSR